MTSDGSPKRTLSVHERRMIFGSLIVALIFLTVALLVPLIVWPDAEPPGPWVWGEAVLINFGAAIALVAPIEWFGSRLRREVEASERRQDERVEGVREESRTQIEALSERVDSLTEMDREVTERLDAAHSADHDLFRKVTEGDADAGTVHGALTRAQALGLISARGIQVPFSAVRGLHITFLPMNGGPPRVHVVLMGDDRNVAAERVIWAARKSATDLLVQLGELARRMGADELPTATQVFGGLADALVFADKHSMARPIIQYFDPQWALTEHSIVAPSHAYDVRHDRVDRVPMDVQVKAKAWLDFDSYDAAHMAAERLFPLTAKQLAYAEAHPRS